MDKKEKSDWVITFADIKGSSWLTIGKWALWIFVLLVLNALVVRGTVETVYGSIAAKEYKQLIYMVVLGYQSLMISLPGLVFLKRPMVAFAVFAVFYCASFVVVPVVVGQSAPEITNCEHTTSTVKNNEYYMKFGNVGFVCREYASRYYGL